MKILELTNYSAGSCGVGARALYEAKLLAEKGHEVRVFSSYFVKGTNEIASREENVGEVRITRFPAKKLGGESYLIWGFEEEAIKFNPDVIIAHAYRHVHTTKALKIAKKIGCKVFLVTHAPFIENNKTRSFVSSLAVKTYDLIFGRKSLNKFNKVIAITKWEMNYLKNIKGNMEGVVYIPNGIPSEFFNQKKSREEEKILFFGRVAPVKSIETLIRAVPLLKDSKIKVEIVGPQEKEYAEKLKTLVKRMGLEKRVKFYGPVYNIKEKIKVMDSAKVFVLPSLTEAMPQALIEAMARGKRVVASNTRGAREIINGKNGLLFRTEDYKDLAHKINIMLRDKSSIGKNARKSVEKFSWDKIIKGLEGVIK